MGNTSCSLCQPEPLGSWTRDGGEADLPRESKSIAKSDHAGHAAGISTQWTARTRAESGHARSQTPLARSTELVRGNLDGSNNSGKSPRPLLSKITSAQSPGKEALQMQGQRATTDIEEVKNNGRQASQTILGMQLPNPCAAESDFNASCDPGAWAHSDAACGDTQGSDTESPGLRRDEARAGETCPKDRQDSFSHAGRNEGFGAARTNQAVPAVAFPLASDDSFRATVATVGHLESRVTPSATSMGLDGAHVFALQVPRAGNETTPKLGLQSSDINPSHRHGANVSAMVSSAAAASSATHRHTRSPRTTAGSRVVSSRTGAAPEILQEQKAFEKAERLAAQILAHEKGQTQILAWKQKREEQDLKNTKVVEIVKTRVVHRRSSRDLFQAQAK